MFQLPIFPYLIIVQIWALMTRWQCARGHHRQWSRDTWPELTNISTVLSPLQPACNNFMCFWIFAPCANTIDGDWFKCGTMLCRNGSYWSWARTVSGYNNCEVTESSNIKGIWSRPTNIPFNFWWIFGPKMYPLVVLSLSNLNEIFNQFQACGHLPGFLEHSWDPRLEDF